MLWLTELFRVGSMKQGTAFCDHDSVLYVNQITLLCGNSKCTTEPHMSSHNLFKIRSLYKLCNRNSCTLKSEIWKMQIHWSIVLPWHLYYRKFLNWGKNSTIEFYWHALSTKQDWIWQAGNNSNCFLSLTLRFWRFLLVRSCPYNFQHLNGRYVNYKCKYYARIFLYKFLKVPKYLYFLIISSRISQTK